jgi:hypothetical protein
MRPEQLHQVINTPGPFASVYLDASHETFDAPRRNELRWQAARAELAAQGADDDTVAAVATVLSERPVVGRAGRAVVAAHGAVLVDEVLPLPPPADVARFSDLPYLLPLLAMSPTPAPYVIVVADKIGARLHVVDRTGVEVADTTVRGADTHVTGGGRGAQGGAESRSEETLRQNAKEIAEKTVTLAEQVSAALVVLAGEVQARAAVRAALPAHVERLVTELDVDANGIKENPELLADGVARMLAQDQAAEEVDAVDRLHIGAAHGTSREGMAGVLDALRSGQVDTLLVTDPLLGDREVWLGADRSQVTMDTSTMPEAGDGLVRRRADEAVPAAAIATSADVLVLTGQTEVTDGVAALLRYA